MTRTGLVPELMQHTPEPLLAINPADAERIGLQAGALARVTTAEGAVVLRAELTHEQRRGEIFAPMHWTRSFAAAGPVGQAVQALCDPASGQPALKATRAQVTPVAAHWHGLLLRSVDGPLPEGALWVRIPLARGQMFRLAGLDALPQGAALDRFAEGLLQAPGADIVEMRDSKRGVLRRASIQGGRLHACLLLAATQEALPRAEVFAPLLGEPVPAASRSHVLAGSLAGDPEGKRVCACFGVGEAAIRHAAVKHGLTTAAEIGALLRAGTNCGSCIPELEKILRDVREPAL